MPSSVQQTFVGRENGSNTENSCKEATPDVAVLRRKIRASLAQYHL